MCVKKWGSLAFYFCLFGSFDPNKLLFLIIYFLEVIVVCKTWIFFIKSEFCSIAKWRKWNFSKVCVGFWFLFLGRHNLLRFIWIWAQSGRIFWEFEAGVFRQCPVDDSKCSNFLAFFSTIDKIRSKSPPTGIIQKLCADFLVKFLYFSFVSRLKSDLKRSEVHLKSAYISYELDLKFLFQSDDVLGKNSFFNFKAWFYIRNFHRQKL